MRFAKYLLSEAARGDHYYTHDGDNDAPTQWHGPEKLLRSFGIDPDKPVELRHLGPLMQGFSPVTGKPIRPAGSDGTRTAGINLCYAPPKEVSALWATADPYRRAQIEAAHRKAVKSTVARIEKEVACVRRKTNKVQRFEKAKGLLATEVVHTTSRLGKDQDEHGIPDPQLHSHIMLLAAERKDGVIAAIESKQLYRSARENGAWYRAQLAANLQELGIGIERHQGNGERYFGLRGVSKELSEHWSKRGKDIDQAANVFRRRYGREPGPGELDAITLSTRGSKTAASPETVNAAWRALGEEHGLTRKRAEEAFHDWGLRDDPDIDLAKELIENVTRESSMVNRHELQAKAYELSAGVCRPEEADRLIVELQRSGELLELEDGTYTTRRLRELERETITAAQRRADETVASVSDQALEAARLRKDRELKGCLSEEQREALQTITGPGGVVILIGQAGTGKGVVLSAATDAWQKEGYEVIGTAVPGATAMRLQADTKSDQGVTADSLITSFEHGHLNLDPNTVIVLDEAGMLDSERLSKLVRLADRAGVKLVLTGDAAQLYALGAGGLFKELEGKVPTAELTEVHRAHHQWEREAWSEVRKGEPGLALARYRAHDRLHVYDTRAEATQAMVESWDQARQGLPPDQTVMITDSSNVERDAMNALAQDRRAQAGELGADRVALPGKPYGLAAGDEVIFTDKFRIKRLKRVENGITGTVIHASSNEDKVTIRTRETKPRDVAGRHREVLGDLARLRRAHPQGPGTHRRDLRDPRRRLADRQGAHVRLPQPRPRAHRRLRQPRGPRRAGHGHGSNRTTGRTHGTQPRTRSHHHQGRRGADRRTRADPAARTDSRAAHAQIEPDTQATPEPTAEQPAQIEPKPRPEPIVDTTEHRALSRAPHSKARAPTQTIDHPERERSAEPSQQHEPPARIAETTARHPAETPSPSSQRDTRASATKRHGSPSTPDRSQRDVSTSIAVNFEAIPRSRGGRACRATPRAPPRRRFPAGRQATTGEKRPSANPSCSPKRYVDKVLSSSDSGYLDRISYANARSRPRARPASDKPQPPGTRPRRPQHRARRSKTDRDALDPADQEYVIEPNIDHTADPEHDTARPPSDRSSGRSTSPRPRPARTADPYIEQAIQEARERQESWERGIDPDRDNDRGFGIE